jgi:hypothetical protein
MATHSPVYGLRFNDEVLLVELMHFLRQAETDFNPPVDAHVYNAHRDQVIVHSLQVACQSTALQDQVKWGVRIVWLLSFWPAQAQLELQVQLDNKQQGLRFSQRWLYLFGYNAMQYTESRPMFRKNMSHGTHFCYRLTKLQGLVWPERLGKFKKSPHWVSNPRPSSL